MRQIISLRVLALALLSSRMYHGGIDNVEKVLFSDNIYCLCCGEI